MFCEVLQESQSTFYSQKNDERLCYIKSQIDSECGLVLLPVLHCEWNPTSTLAMIVLSLELFVGESPSNELNDSLQLQAKH